MPSKPKAPTLGPSESELQRGAMRYLDAQNDLIAYRVNCGGIATPQGGFFRGAPIGTPDIQGAMRGGRAFYIELKTAKNIVSEFQREWHYRARELGIAVFVCRNFAAVLSVIRYLRKRDRDSLSEDNLDAHRRMAVWNQLEGRYDE